MKLYRMHRKNNFCKGIWRDAPWELEIELSSQYGNCGAEGLEEDDYFALCSFELISVDDLKVLSKYGYVVSCVHVSEWGEVQDEDGNILECIFKMKHVTHIEECKY